MTHLQNQSKSSITKSRFDEIQKANIEILRKRVENYSSADDSDDDVEIDKKNIDALFKNYEGKRDEIDQASIKIFTFLENGENIDCLICKFFFDILLFDNLFFVFRHKTNQK